LVSHCPSTVARIDGIGPSRRIRSSSDPSG
jgi:hypothetical protein